MYSIVIKYISIVFIKHNKMKCLNRKILKKNVDVDEEIVQKHDIFQKVTD